MASHVFPDNLREKDSYPVIKFSVDGVGEAVYLPIPQGLVFADNMNYSTTNLGIIGDAAKQTAEILNGTAGNDKNEGAISSIASMLGNKINLGSNAASATMIATKMLAPSGASDVIGLGLKKILAPNTNSIFQGSAVRQFNFGFKLVARTQKDATTSKAIVDVFRKYMYPEGNEILLSYPNTWQITFDKANLPEIKQCYLTSMSATYNSSTNAFYTDNSPLEVDVALTFQETKALYRGDLYKN